MNNSHCNAASSTIVFGASGDPLLTRSRVAVTGGIADDGGDTNALHVGDDDDSRAAAVAAWRKEVIRPISNIISLSRLS